MHARRRTWKLGCVAVEIVVNTAPPGKLSVCLNAREGGRHEHQLGERGPPVYANAFPLSSLWLNVGDSYSSHPTQGAAKKSRLFGPERLVLALAADVLHGVWIEADQGPDQLFIKIDRMLTASPTWRELVHVWAAPRIGDGHGRIALAKHLHNRA